MRRMGWLGVCFLCLCAGPTQAAAASRFEAVCLSLLEAWGLLEAEPRLDHEADLPLLNQRARELLAEPVTAANAADVFEIAVVQGFKGARSTWRSRDPQAASRAQLKRFLLAHGLGRPVRDNRDGFFMHEPSFSWDPAVGDAGSRSHLMYSARVIIFVERRVFEKNVARLLRLMQEAAPEFSDQRRIFATRVHSGFPAYVPAEIASK